MPLGSDGYSSGFGVISEPFVTETILSSDCTHVVVASDGLFNEVQVRRGRWLRAMGYGREGIGRGIGGETGGTAVWEGIGGKWGEQVPGGIGDGKERQLQRRGGGKKTGERDWHPLSRAQRGGGGGMTNEEVAQACKAQGSKSCTELAAELIEQAVSNGSTDDVTVCVLKLDRSKLSAAAARKEAPANAE